MKKRLNDPFKIPLTRYYIRNGFKIQEFSPESMEIRGRCRGVTHRRVAKRVDAMRRTGAGELSMRVEEPMRCEVQARGEEPMRVEVPARANCRCEAKNRCDAERRHLTKRR